MKKITKFMLASVTVLAVASCQKEMANEPEGSFETFTVTASIGTDTKTVLDDDANKIYWTPGDEISLFNTSGVEVVFDTDITEKSVSATFNNKTAFDAPDNLLAVYPTRTDNETTYKEASNTIENLHIGGAQTAIAGSFDPRYAVAIGTEIAEGKLSFKNIHSLIKFTIGGEVAPSIVTLQCNGDRSIAGLFNYNTSTGAITQSDGSKIITLEGAFEVGKTYYIAVIPGMVGKGVTLYFDGVEVKDTGINKDLEPNKIYNVGTLSKPAEFENEFAKRLWGKYAPKGDGWIVMGAGNLDRGMAMDDKYVYVSKSTEYAPVIKAFNIADGTEAFDVDVTGMGSSNAWGDAMKYSVNCVRTIQKNDGSYILLACNLKLDSTQVLEIWAWVNGPQSAPTCIGRYAYDSVANAQDHRRYGDRFDVKGTWEDGELWFPSCQADDHGKTLMFKTFTGVDNSNRPAKYYRMEPSQSNMKDLAFYPGSDEVFSTCNGNAKFVKLDGTTHSTGWINWGITDDYSSTHTRTYGYNFFEVNDSKYIVYVKIDKANGRTGRLMIIRDGDGTLDGFKSALTANNVVFEAPLHHISKLDKESLSYTGNTLANCKVVVKDGVTYIGAHIQGLGLSVFQVK